MAGESILLLWVLGATAFALGWAVRHWLHRAARQEDPIDPARQEPDPDPIELVIQDQIDLREESETSRDKDR